MFQSWVVIKSRPDRPKLLIMTPPMCRNIQIQNNHFQILQDFSPSFTFVYERKNIKILTQKNKS